VKLKEPSYCLAKLDNIFDTAKAASIARQIEKAAHYDSSESGWVVANDHTDIEDWPRFGWQEIIDDGWHDKHLLYILARMYREAKNPCFLALFAIPAGRGLWGSMFGARLEYTDTSGVWVLPPEGLTIDKLIDQGVPDVCTAGIAPLVLDISRFFLDRLAQFENLTKLYTIAIEPDGILEVLVALLGQHLFEEMLLRPDVVKKLFEMVQETQFRYCSLIQRLFKPEIDQARMFLFKRPFSQHGYCRIVEDSAIVLSPDLYRAFCLPYNEAMFERYAPGEGYVHFCGDGNNIMDAVLETKGLRGVHPGQTEFYNIKQLYPRLAERGVSMRFTRRPEWSDGDVENILYKRPGVIVLDM